MDGCTKCPQFMYAVGTSIGAFITGCCIGLVAPYDSDIIENPSFTNKTWGLSVWWVRACLPLSAFAFCKVAALDILRKGPMTTLKISSLVFFVAILLYGAFLWKNENREDYELLFVYRIILGLGCGFTSTAIPLYLSEIAEKNIRGLIGCLFYTQLSLGILASYCLLVFCDFVWICVFGLFTTLLFISSVHLKPNSPLYLVRLGEEDEAKKAMVRLRSKNYDAANELNVMRSVAMKYKEASSTPFLIFQDPSALRGLLVACGLMFLQQFSGIHTVLLEAVPAFKESFTDFDVRFSIILVEVVLVLGVLPAMFLVDFAGRRLLLLISAGSMAAFMLALAVCCTIGKTGLGPLVLQFSFVFIFSFGFGPVPWIMLAEVFPLNIRENAAFLVAGSFWLLHYLSADVYIEIRKATGPDYTMYFFWSYFILLIIAFLFVFFLVPETKQKNFQDLEDLFLKSSST